MSFRPVGDEDLAEVQGDDGFDAFGTKKSRKKPAAPPPGEREAAAASPGPPVPEEADEAAAPAAAEAVTADDDVPEEAGDPVDEGERPSLFVRPAALGGPRPRPVHLGGGEGTRGEQPSFTTEDSSDEDPEPAPEVRAEEPPSLDELTEDGVATEDDEPQDAEQPQDAEPSDGQPQDAEPAEEQRKDAEPAEERPQGSERPQDAEPGDEQSQAAQLADADADEDSQAEATLDEPFPVDGADDDERPEPEPADGDEPEAERRPRDGEDPRDGDEPLDGAKPQEGQAPREGQEPQARGEKPGGGAATGEKPGRVEELPAEAAEALMAALGTLRESVADLRFGLDLPGAEEARQAQGELLAQLEGYVLPRVRTSAAPALIVVAGSTGAGKSTLVNTLAEKTVSRTGVRRPTTGTPVLVCHPDDRKWFAEGELLGGLQRLDKPAPEAGVRSMVVVATEKLPQGVALLDTPDIDSVVEEHHEVAHRMLDAADLWIFVTTAARYADAPAWNLLKLAKERGARLAIVLSRVQPRSAEVVLKHFVRMLTEYGLGEIDRFVINEAKVTDGRLPDAEVTDLRLWLAELSVDEERRAQAVRETLNGVLNSFRTRVPALARHLEGQVAFRTELRSDVEAAFRGALGEIDKASKNGSLLHGEVLARWQDFAGSGDLMRSLQVRKRGRSAKHAPERVLAFKAAIRAGLEAVIVAAANRATEEVVQRWRHRSELGAKLGEGLDRPSDNLVRHAGRAIASWQEHLSELVRTDGVAKRSVSKLVSFDPDALSLIFTVAMFSGTNGEGVPHRLVNALLGAESLRGIGAKALSDLRARIGMLFDEESMRYVQALDTAGIPDESVATRLYQATYNLEVAR
ncbi:dynamin family protein [Nonomuraea angiospora]|uniref:dynamin family protein n=1 Tax=Nonomuraea angiospora TaxID=46172 RepID=UPI0037A71876